VSVSRCLCSDTDPMRLEDTLAHLISLQLLVPLRNAFVSTRTCMAIVVAVLCTQLILVDCHGARDVTISVSLPPRTPCSTLVAQPDSRSPLKCVQC
jgi:hypothetical protein